MGAALEALEFHIPRDAHARGIVAEFPKQEGHALCKLDPQRSLACAICCHRFFGSHNIFRSTTPAQAVLRLPSRNKGRSGWHCRLRCLTSAEVSKLGIVRDHRAERRGVGCDGDTQGEPRHILAKLLPPGQTHAPLPKLGAYGNAHALFLSACTSQGISDLRERFPSSVIVDVDLRIFAYETHEHVPGVAQDALKIGIRCVVQGRCLSRERLQELRLWLVLRQVYPQRRTCQRKFWS
mmetsp:Transcript_19700/g.52616  ORF Transcript_19700/g.52616 Transcript_19700/m.52616 type:complete len:237 (-) Transcript_19700:850-1560(-)